MRVVRIGAPLTACVMLFCGGPTYAQQTSMSFFVTSAGPGKGADLGGLAGADVIASSLRVLSERAPKPGTLICRRRAPGP